MDTLVAPLVSATTVATLLQLVKNSPLIPWITRDTGRLNSLLAIIAAGLTTVGLSFSGTIDDSTGAFTLGVSGTIGGLIDGIAHWVGQWTAQHAIYKGLIAPAEMLGEMRTIMQTSVGMIQPVSKPPHTHGDSPIPTLGGD